MNKIVKAYTVAKELHKNQKRKYSGRPYLDHCEEVFMILYGATYSEDMLCAGLLHDVVEDTEATIDFINDIFGSQIALYVDGMTDIATQIDGNRETRKRLDRERISKCCSEVHTIKLADMISNMPGIIKNDSELAKVYLNEKRKLLKVLDKGNQFLYNKAKEIIDNYYKQKEIKNENC